MKDADKLSRFFSDSRSSFIIPLYQRKYAWQDKHCKRLFEDLKKIHNDDIRTHFFGSIVSKRVNETDDDIFIIDGQQRLTTISILILAASNAVANGEMELGNEKLETVKEEFLYAIRKRSNRKIKLTPIEEDMSAYDALFRNEPLEYIKESGITKNYWLFYEMIKSENLSFADLIDAIERLIIIDIRLDSGDNPQLIFESLNSCGKDLEEADKVRNYLLMSLDAVQQEEYYHSYWSKIERLTDGEPTMFIRDYLTINKPGHIISNIEDLYFDFKTYDETKHLDRRELLADMLKYARYYRQITNGETGNAKLDRKLKQIASIGSTVHLPFLLSFFEHANRMNLDNDEKYAVLDIVEGYWARRIICYYPANALSKIFAILHGEIMRIYKRHQERGVALELPYSEILKYVLLRKQGTGLYPTDSQVEQYFPTRQIYRIPSNYRLFLFERMENENSPEANDTIVDKMKSGQITIEHIMPQTLTSQWKLDLGEDWENIHNTYLHTLANLTLTGFNVSYSNHSFKEKKLGYIDKNGNKVNGFDDSAFCLSNYLKQCNKWTLVEIIERQKILLNNFLRLWPMPVTNYIPLEKEFELVSFNDEEFELTGRYISGFRYKNIRYKVETWKDMLVQVCKLLHDEAPSTMTYLAKKNYWIHDTDNKESTQFADSCYVHTSCSTNTKRSIINYLFKEFNTDPETLEFELEPVQQEKAIDSSEE